MGIRVLNDPAQGYAALYCSTTGIPLSIEVFSDVDNGNTFVGAEEAAGRFLSDATEHFDGKDLRSVPMPTLRDYQARWFRENLTGGEWSVKNGG